MVELPLNLASRPLEYMFVRCPLVADYSRFHRCLPGWHWCLSPQHLWAGSVQTLSRITQPSWQIHCFLETEFSREPLFKEVKGRLNKKEGPVLWGTDEFLDQLLVALKSWQHSLKYALLWVRIPLSSFAIQPENSIIFFLSPHFSFLLSSQYFGKSTKPRGLPVVALWLM